jgi:hypothetical protein
MADDYLDERGRIIASRGPDGELHPPCAACQFPILPTDLYFFVYERAPGLGYFDVERDFQMMIHADHIQGSQPGMGHVARR